MRSHLLTRCFCLLVAMLAANASADTEYWVAVGSFQSLEYAELAQTKASQSLPEAFSVTPVDTASGYYYRVAAGPYLSRGIADSMASDARKAGFEDAWVVAADSPSLDTDSYSPLAIPAAVSESDYPISEAPSASGVTRSPGLDLPDRRETEVPHELVEEAPEGYQLNKLHRD